MNFADRGKKPRIQNRLAITVLLLGFFFAGCETRESLMRKRIKNVEKGLLKAVFLKGLKPEKKSLAERMQFYKVPGVSMAVMDQYKIEWARAYGVKDVQTLEPVTPDTVFQAGALSQPVAAAAALRFVDKGFLDLEGDVAGKLRSWKITQSPAAGRKKVLLSGLLTHSAGFPARVFPGIPQDKPVPSLVQVLNGEAPAETFPLEIEYPPGSQALYTESGFVILQQLLADIDDSPFPALMKTAVLDPAGMSSSTFELPFPEGLRPRAAAGHMRNGQLLEGKWLNYPELAAKGLWSTASDLASFALEIVAEAMGKSTKILSASSARAMLTPRIGTRGLGFAGEGSAEDSHFFLQGKTEGFTCGLVFYPARGQGAVIISNSENGSLLIDEILRGISDAYKWPDYKAQERPLFRLDPSIYQQYVGRYQVTSDYFLDVTYEDYYLVIRPTGQAPTKFYVENQSMFFSMDPFIRIQFRKDEKGNVEGIVLWQQDFEQTAKKIN